MTCPPSARLRPAWLTFLGLMLAVLLSMSAAGCLHGSDQDEIQIPQEELYIDVRLGFSVIHPLAWERIEAPLPAPGDRYESVNWRIPAADGPGTMLVRVYPDTAGSAVLPNLLEQFLEGRAAADAETEAYQHAVGEAVAATIHGQTYTERLFAINGMQNAYLLSFSGEPESIEKNASLFDRIVESLRELKQPPPRYMLDRQ